MYLSFHLIATIIFIVVVVGAIQGLCAYLILAERKISAWVQDRLGPNRVGPGGLLQPIADGLKFLLKEEVIPGHVDRLFYMLAPMIAVSTAMFAFCVVPFGPTEPAPRLLDYRTDAQVARSREALSPDDLARVRTETTEFRAEGPRGTIWPQTKAEEAFALGADRAWAKARNELPYEERLQTYNNNVQYVFAPHVNVGVVFVFAIGSLAVYAIVLGGWASNNKYSFLGSLRSSAQIISYEIPMGMSVLGVMLITGSLNLERMIDYQCYHGWNVFQQPLAALLFAVSIFAETNRLPFDLPEAEQELVGGYHTEYSGMKFAMFFLGEYTHMVTTSFLIVILFFGGWQLPWIATAAGGVEGIGGIVLKIAIIWIKMTLFIVFFMLIRWTLPRFRFDQLMGLAWKVMMPLALLNLVCVLVVKQLDINAWWLLPMTLFVLVVFAMVTLLMPRARPRVPVVIRGHPIGAPAILYDEETLGTR